MRVRCSLCFSRSDLLVVELSRYIHQLSLFLLFLPRRSQERCSHPQVARCRLTIEMFQLMTSWVKTSAGPSECPSLAMRCVILALSETWALNLMIEKCGQKPMKTPNGHNKVFHGPILDHQPHVPNRPQPIPRLGTQLTWKVNCRSKELKLKLRISGPNMSCFFPGRS